MHLRRQTIQLLILMLQNNRKTVQDLLLNSPMAVSKFMATLSDPLEVIRNDVRVFIFMRWSFIIAIEPGLKFRVALKDVDLKRFLGFFCLQ